MTTLSRDHSRRTKQHRNDARDQRRERFDADTQAAQERVLAIEHPTPAQQRMQYVILKARASASDAQVHESHQRQARAQRRQQHEAQRAAKQQRQPPPNLNPWLAVSCPRCRALPTVPCSTPTGKPTEPHKARRGAAL